jgi:hypothetical protein
MMQNIVYIRIAASRLSSFVAVNVIVVDIVMVVMKSNSIAIAKIVYPY